MLKVVNLVKEYAPKIALFQPQTKHLQVIKQISFEIAQNEVVGLVGETGCGKSTLARLLVGLEKSTLGSIFFQGEAINQLKGKKLKYFHKNSQLIFQDTLAALNPSLKINQILNEPLDNHFQFDHPSKRKLIEEMLAMVELNPEILKRYPNNLSGGERQRVNICRALLLRPKLLICDEITSSQDLLTQMKILKLLKELSQEFHMSLLFISHNLQAVQSLSQRILVMQQGRIVEELTPEKIPLQIRDSYAQKLFASLPIAHPSKRSTC